MKAYTYLLLPIIILFTSCFSRKTTSNYKNETRINNDTITISSISFKKCHNDFDCDNKFDCYHKYFELFPRFDNNLKIESRNYFIMDSLKSCIISLYMENGERSNAADQSLYKYYLNIFLKSSKNGRSPIPRGNLNEHIMHRWNSRKSFDVCILLMSKNYHDSMGHGDCTNVGYEFFMQIVLPKIKSIDGVDFWTYYFRSNPPHMSPFYGDCYDRFYTTMYPLLKKAWEEGKIELNETNVK